VTGELLAEYQLLRSHHRLNHQLVARWKCALGGCGLLDVWIRPGTGELCYSLPAYRNSPDLNVTSSNSAGRAKNTRDGGDDRHWKGRAGLVSDAINFELKCDHHRGVIVDADDVPRSTSGRPTIFKVGRAGVVTAR
jgi:hypothetical protein